MQRYFTLRTGTVVGDAKATVAAAITAAVGRPAGDSAAVRADPTYLVGNRERLEVVAERRVARDVPRKAHARLHAVLLEELQDRQYNSRQCERPVVTVAAVQ